VGIGRFLKYAPVNEQVVAYEINYYSAKICAVIYPNAVVKTTSFETEFFDGRKQKRPGLIKPKFTLVIGNPPYGNFAGKYAGMGEAKKTGAKEYDQYFITRGLDLLMEDGILCMIVPSNFLKNGSAYNKLKEKIAEKAELIDAYRMPMGIFETTDIGTDIVLFKKKAA
jgi:type I restriction-modification system DNA methylase subunit